MKKLIAFAMVCLVAGSLSLQAQDSKYMHTGTYELAFTDEVMIQIGAAKENKTTSEWEKGSKVGKTTIDPAIFSELQKATSGKFTIQIEKKKIGTLHGIQATDLESGKIMKGIYNEKDDKFTFGAAKTQHNNGGAKTDIGIIAGKFSKDKSAIENGEFGIGFIAGKAPTLITARAVFYYSAKAVAK